MGEMMNIQKEKVRKELVSLCLGEFTAVLSIWFCFFLLKNRLGDWNGLISILHPISEKSHLFHFLVNISQNQGNLSVEQLDFININVIQNLELH